MAREIGAVGAEKDPLFSVLTIFKHALEPQKCAETEGNPCEYPDFRETQVL